MARARAYIPESLSGLLRADLEAVIKQANLGKENTRIARMYYLDAMPQVEIGTAVGLTRSAVSKRLSGILGRFERTARRMNIC
ncbi:MAG: hypothetical protein HDT14_13820 [Oscillibacter sp.]|nr:hypothetical protein [Oscillibacter sp.]